MPPPIPPSVYQAVFDSSPVGEYLLTPSSSDPVILAANDSLLRATGRTRASLVGQRLFDAFPGNPDDADNTGEAAVRASLARVIASGRADALPMQRYPIRTTGADGQEAFEERYWHAINMPIFDAAGTLVCIAHRTEDVTERARTAQALARSNDRHAFELALADRLRPLTSPDDIATTAAAMLGGKFGITRVTYVEVDDANGSFVQRHWQSGVQPPAPPERRRLDDFGPEIIDTLRRGEPLVIRDVQADPRTQPHAAAYASIGVRANLAIPLLKSGLLSLVLSLQHEHPRDWPAADIELALDVAERTWSAAENARAQAALREASQRKDEFLAMLAHELRNPLAPISVAAGLLAQGRLDEARLRRTSEVISRQVRHMTGLVDDLLDVSRVTRGVVTLQEAPQDMKGVLASAAEQVRPLMEAQRHQLTLDLPPVAATVRGDGKRLVQVVGNLLNNAAKFTPPGGHIQVRLTVDDARVQVHVQDDGVGIPPDLQPRIFDLFSQAERAPDRSQGGLGLGLALVKSLVEQHGGSVSAASTQAGSCFTVTLPLLAAAPTPPAPDAAAAPDAPAAPAAPPHRQPQLQPLDVLIVDDNRDAAAMLQLLLEQAGHRVRVEHDPQRALAAALQQPPQVGLIDIGLPGMDGYELVRRLKAAAPTAQARFVALTGYGQEADRAQALAAGFDEHLVKPADPATVVGVLARLGNATQRGSSS